MLLALLLACSAAHRLGYDTPDRGDFRRWSRAAPEAAAYPAFEAFLAAEGVAEVAPAWHLWRQGTDWRALGEPPFAAPPAEAWPGMARTLRVVRDEVVPRVGPVEVVSAWRTPAYNTRAGGAAGSRHLAFEAVDLVPCRRWTREALHAALRAWWTERGEPLAVGLGTYDGLRFHVDTWRYRTW